MNNHTAMPTVTFEEGTDYDTLDSIITGWIVRVWLKQGVILTGRWDGSADDMTTLMLTKGKTADFDKEIQFPTDDVTRVSIR